MGKLLEKDLFYIVKDFYVSAGYAVQAEVMDVDLIASKEEKLILVELKVNFNVQLLYQALERKKISDNVYVAVFKPKRFSLKDYRHMLNLCKQLKIGLILVDSKSLTCKIVIDPRKSEIKKSKYLKFRKLYDNLVLVNQTGGINKEKVFTLYMQESFKVLLILKKLGVSSPSNIKRCDIFIVEPQKILSNNYYDWFEKVSRGKYQLSKKGNLFLLNIEDIELKSFENNYNNKVINNI